MICFRDRNRFPIMNDIDIVSCICSKHFESLGIQGSRGVETHKELARTLIHVLQVPVDDRVPLVADEHGRLDKIEEGIAALGLKLHYRTHQANFRRTCQAKCPLASKISIRQLIG